MCVCERERERERERVRTPSGTIRFFEDRNRASARENACN